MTTAANNTVTYASEFPLPGGVEQYFDTLVAILRHIRDDNVTPDSLSQWMFKTFPNSSGQIAVNGYIAVLSRQRLWLQQDNLIRLTPEGTSVVTKAETTPWEARQIVMGIKYREFLGYDVLFTFLADGPRGLDVIHEHLRGALSVNWKTKNQTTYRVNWLRSLGYVEKNGKEYRLTENGMTVFQELRVKPEETIVTPPPPDEVVEVTFTPLVKRAMEISERLERLAVAGGDGREFEKATEAAFTFLGFDTQLIGGSGNPDVLATAMMGESTYRVLIDSKSRSSGTVLQNDVPFLVLEKQQKIASADYVVVVGAGFAGGQLDEFAAKNKVRLLSTSDLRELLLAHAESAFPLDVLRPLFRGGGTTDEGLLSDILTSAESKSEVILLARSVFAAVRQFQDKSGAIHTDSLYYILGCEHSLSTIKLALDFLKSDLIEALGETERGSLYTRVSPTTLTNRLSQLIRMMDLSELPNG